MGSNAERVPHLLRSDIGVVGKIGLILMDALVRCAAPEWNSLRDIVFSRYPELEWATFARFGWREAKDRLIVTLAAIDPPSGTDLDDSVGHVAISEPYSLRMALGAEKHSLAVGVIHSHPENCPPIASAIATRMIIFVFFKV